MMEFIVTRLGGGGAKYTGSYTYLTNQIYYYGYSTDCDYRMISIGANSTNLTSATMACVIATTQL